MKALLFDNIHEVLLLRAEIPQMCEIDDNGLGHTDYPPALAHSDKTIARWELRVNVFLPFFGSQCGDCCRMSPQSLSETTVIAFTVGAANLATLHWIQDLRSRLSNSSSTASPTSTSQPWASPGGKTTTTATAMASPSSVITSPGATTPTGRDSPPATTGKDRALLLLLKGKQGRSESSPAAIEQAVSSLLTATNVPHAVSQTPQVCFTPHDSPSHPVFAAKASLLSLPCPTACFASPYQFWNKQAEKPTRKAPCNPLQLTFCNLWSVQPEAMHLP